MIAEPQISPLLIPKKPSNSRRSQILSQNIMQWNFVKIHLHYEPAYATQYAVNIMEETSHLIMFEFSTCELMSEICWIESSNFLVMSKFLRH
jgi:hypothetical protein